MPYVQFGAHAYDLTVPIDTLTFAKTDFNAGAASIAAGVASLMKDLKPSLLQDDIRSILSMTAIDVHTPGYDGYTGFGRIDADAATKYAAEYSFSHINDVVAENLANNQVKSTIQLANSPHAYKIDVWPRRSSMGNVSFETNSVFNAVVDVKSKSATAYATKNNAQSGSKISFTIAEKFILEQIRTNHYFGLSGEQLPSLLLKGSNSFLPSGKKIIIPTTKKMVLDGKLISQSNSSFSDGSQIEIFGELIGEAGSELQGGYIVVKSGGKLKLLQNSQINAAVVFIESGGVLEMDDAQFKGAAGAGITSSGKIIARNVSFTKSGTSNFSSVMLSGAGASGSVFENVTITGSTHGLQFYNAGTVTLTNIAATGNTNQAVKLVNTAAVVSRGNFYGNTNTGISLQDYAWATFKNNPLFSNNATGVYAANTSYVFGDQHGALSSQFFNHTHSGVHAYNYSGVYLGVEMDGQVFGGYNWFDGNTRHLNAKVGSFIQSEWSNFNPAAAFESDATSIIDITSNDGGPLKAVALTSLADSIAWFERQEKPAPGAMKLWHNVRSRTGEQASAAVLKKKVHQLNQPAWTVATMLEAQRAGDLELALELAHGVVRGKTFSADDQKSAWYLLFRAAVDANNKAEARKALRELKKLKHEDAENGFCDLLLDGASADENPKSEIAHPKSVVSAHPNPFNPSTTLTVTLSRAENITLAVYDINGRRIMELASGAYQQGVHTFRFNASHLASGMYLWRLHTTAGIQTGKITLLK